MKDPQTVTEILEQEFNRIHREQMQDIPILNPAIQVQALGFHENQGRVLGVMITPWMMNLVMLPRDDEDWSTMQLGEKQPHQFPSKCYQFMANEIDGIGPCQTHSLYSPMNAFASHEQAVNVAQAFLDNLMVEQELTEEELADGELLDRMTQDKETPEVKVQVKEKISRRDLLRGDILRDG